AIFSLMAILNVVLYWTFIPYRSQQRFMLQALGLGVLPLALLLDRRRWIGILAALLLGLHLLTPQFWPFAGHHEPIPWDLSPLVPNAIPALIPLFPRLASMMRPDRSDSALVSAGMLGAILAASVWATSAWCRFAARPSREGWRLLIAVAATAVL